MQYKVIKSFIERNGKIRKKGDTINMVDIVADFYEKHNYIKMLDDIKDEDMKPVKRGKK